MGVGAQRHTKGTGKTEIRKLQVSLSINEQVLRLEIAVKDAAAVAVLDAIAELAHELFDHGVAETKTSEINGGALGQSLAATAITDWQSLHVLLQIEIEEFENEVELVAIGMDNVEEADNVGIAHLLEQRDLADGSAWHTLILSLEADLLESNDAAVVGKVAGFVDDTIGS